MRLLHSIHWRIAIAYTVLTLISMGAVSLYLVLFVRDTFSGDTQVQAAVNRIIGTIGAATGIAVVLSVLLAFFIAKRTTRSIRAVTEGARRLAAGDLEHRVSALYSDETRDLADAFNHMVRTLKLMIADLSTERNKLSSVLATMTDGVLVIDREGQVTLANPAAHNLLDIRLPQPQGRRFVEMVRDHEIQQILMECQRTGQLQHKEIELTWSRKYLSVIATPLVSEIEQGVLLVLHDLTEARRVDVTRREFVANVSHELRSPLASIKVGVETLEDGALEEPQVARQFLKRLNRDIDRMSHMVDELLELSMLETGQAGLDLSSISMERPIREAVEQYRAKAERKGLTLSSDLPPQLPPVLGDESKVHQVLSNLLDNAIKFTPSGGHIKVTAYPIGELLATSVTDTGIGIPREHLDHVFERFYKVDRSRRDGGAGLGLAIAKHIVQAHGGSIWVESREGEGSTFTFTIPVDKPKSPS